MKLTSLIALMFFCFGCKGQTKDTPKGDTVQTGYVIQIILDSSQYKYVMDFIGAQPIGNEKIQTVYTLLSGALKNVRYQPTYAIKPKAKK